MDLCLGLIGVSHQISLQEENQNLDAAIDALLNVEKQARLAGDVAGTKKAVIDIVELCYKARAWKTLNDQIILLSKRRGQLKQVEELQNSVFCRGFIGLRQYCLYFRVFI